MFNLFDKSTSYLIVSPGNNVLCESVCTILYSRDYTIIPIKSYYRQEYSQSFIAFSMTNNDSLREDAIYLMDNFYNDSVIVKYRSEDYPKIIRKDGSERLLETKIYSDTDSKIYIYNGVSFSFNEQSRYNILVNKSQIKRGMIVEFFNNNKWNKKEVVDVDLEYEKMYKLLIKYQKLRVSLD